MMRHHSLRRILGALLLAFAAGLLTAYANPVRMRAEVRGEIAMMEHSAIAFVFRVRG
jgi:hypothetical protein